jgi:hypothetical protein
MRIPVKLLFFLALAGFFYGFILPKKAAFSYELIKTFRGGPASGEDSAKVLVEARVRADICPQADLSEYRPVGWSDYAAGGQGESMIIHRFTCDGQERKFLFRVRHGVVAEIVDLL